MLETNGQLFGVTFIKQNGDERDMCCRIGVRKGVKGVIDRVGEDAANNLLTVYDFNADKKGGFRRINLNTVKRLQIKGEEINIGN